MTSKIRQGGRRGGVWETGRERHEEDERKQDTEQAEREEIECEAAGGRKKCVLSHWIGTKKQLLTQIYKITAA